MERLVLAAFYKFVTLKDYREMRESLLEFCKENNVKGTIILAEEGINQPSLDQGREWTESLPI